MSFYDLDLLRGLVAKRPIQIFRSIILPAHSPLSLTGYSGCY